MIDCVFILAGGRGTRLGPLTDDNAKPMLTVAKKPFILHILDRLPAFLAKQVVISTGYKSEQFRDYFDTNRAYDISLFEEQLPLGTGGSLKKYLNYNNDLNSIIVMNGDSLIFNDDTYWEAMLTSNSDCMVATKVDDRTRFGSISFDKEFNITNFSEKKLIGPGYVNAGIYCIKDLARLSSVLKTYPEKFSLEDLLTEMVKKYKVKLVPSIGRLIDMGTPESLKEMEHFLEN